MMSRTLFDLNCKIIYKAEPYPSSPWSPCAVLPIKIWRMLNTAMFQELVFETVYLEYSTVVLDWFWKFHCCRKVLARWSILEGLNKWLVNLFANVFHRGNIFMINNIGETVSLTMRRATLPVNSFFAILSLYVFVLAPIDGFTLY